MKRAHWLGIFAVGCSGAIAAVACGGSDASSNAPSAPDGGSTITPAPTSTSTPDSSTTSPDGSSDDDDDGDASTIDDGGGNIDPDAGDDDDAGDAAPCNTVTNDATSILSVCSSEIPGLTGGALVAATYHLTSAAALGSASFCKNQFVPVRIAETLVLTVDGTGVGTAQIVTALQGSAKSKATTLTLAPANNASPLEQTQTCPAKPEEKTIYESVVRNGKQVLVIEENYGTGRALYRYDQE